MWWFFFDLSSDNCTIALFSSCRTSGQRCVAYLVYAELDPLVDVDGEAHLEDGELAREVGHELGILLRVSKIEREVVEEVLLAL